MGPAETAILDTTVKAEIAQCCLIFAQAAYSWWSIVVLLVLCQVIEAQRSFEDPFAFFKLFFKCALANSDTCLLFSLYYWKCQSLILRVLFAGRKDSVESEAPAELLWKPGFCSSTFGQFCQVWASTGAFWGIPCVANMEWQRSSGCNYVLSNRMAPQGGKNPPKIINRIFGRVSC